MQTITTRTVAAPKIRQPLGGNFELTINVTGLSLTGKTVSFVAEPTSSTSTLERYLLDSAQDAAEIAVSGSTITINLPPQTPSNDDAEYLLSALAAAGSMAYAVTITDDAEDDQVAARVQGVASWLRDLGGFTPGAAGAPVFDLTVTTGPVFSLEISTVGGGSTVDGAAIAALVHAATEKETIADNDEIAGADSAASYGFKKWKWSTVWTTVSTMITNAIWALNLGTASQQASSAFATAAQGTKADSALQSIADASVTNAKLDNMAQATVKGRAAAAGTGAPVDLTATQLRALQGLATTDSPTLAGMTLGGGLLLNGGFGTGINITANGGALTFGGAGGGGSFYGTGYINVRTGSASRPILSLQAISGGAANAHGIQWYNNSLELISNGAGVLEQKYLTTAQKFRVYGSETGSKYIQVEHDGTNSKISSSSGRLCFLNPVGLPVYTVAAALALVGMAEGDEIYVSNETGGKTIAFYNGTNWVRATDLTPIA